MYIYLIAFCTRHRKNNTNIKKRTEYIYSLHIFKLYDHE